MSDSAIKAAIECLEKITYEDEGRRHASYHDWVDLNEPNRGNVDQVLAGLRAALGEKGEA